MGKKKTALLAFSGLFLISYFNRLLNVGGSFTC